MKKFFKIFGVIVVVIILAIIISIYSFVGVRIILAEIVWKYNYPLFVRLATIGVSKDRLVDTVIDFNKNLEKICDIDLSMNDDEKALLKSAIKTGYNGYKINGEAKILGYYSASRGYPIYRLGTYSYLDPRANEVIAFDWKLKILRDLAEKKKRLEKNITGEEACDIANRYLEIIGKPPDTGDPVLLGIYNHKGSRSNFDYYCVYFPKVYKGYEYDSLYSGIWIEVTKDNGELIGYRKKFWGQKKVSTTINISKDEAIQRIKDYDWKRIEEQSDTRITKPIEIGEPKLFIVSPDYWPYLWKGILFLNRSKACLAWVIPVKELEPSLNSSNWIDIYVDAKTGKIVGGEGWFYGRLGEL